MPTDKEFLNELRYKGLVNGKRPFMIVADKKSDMRKLKCRRYLLSYDESKIYFQSLAMFTHLPNKKDDFFIPLNKVKNYIYNPINQTLVSVSFYGLKEYKNKCLTIYIYRNIHKYLQSELHFNDFIKYLNQKGIKDIDEEFNEEGTGTN